MCVSVDQRHIGVCKVCKVTAMQTWNEIAMKSFENQRVINGGKL